MTEKQEQIFCAYLDPQSNTSIFSGYSHNCKLKIGLTAKNYNCCASIREDDVGLHPHIAKYDSLIAQNCPLYTTGSQLTKRMLKKFLGKLERIIAGERK